MKASGSSASLLQGVSQQVPQDRGPGQHGEQINLLPDPVHGLTRRHGSIWVAEHKTALNPALFPNYLRDTDSYRSFEYSNGGKDYTVLYRSAARAPGSDLPVVLVYNQTDAVMLPYTRAGTDPQLSLLESGGISAITAVGKYVFMAGYSTSAVGTTEDVLNSDANRKDAVLWVRGGAYSRTFKATATREDGTDFSFEYTTPTSSYPETLDTSKVPVYAADPAGGTIVDTEAAHIRLIGGAYRYDLGWGAWTPSALTAKRGATAMTNVHPAAPATVTEFAWGPGASFVTFHSTNLGAIDVSLTYTHVKTITNPTYASIVQGMTVDYNSAVTKWIGDAAKAIQPENIAQKLLEAATAAGLSGGLRQASTVIFTNVIGISVSDGGDGTLVRGVANEVSSIDQVSDVHKIGKVVRVRARNSAESFYLKAVSQNPELTAGYAEVTWVEGAGDVHTITSGLLRGVVHGGNFCVASTAALLNTLVPGPHPNYSQSTVGDSDSSPMPFFVGKQITYLGVFQDRLLVGAGAVIRASRTGDYLNFFRTSVLTVPADDPLEMLSQGTDDDTLRHSVLYDRDLVLFADKRQYVISGRVALTPTSANMPVMSSHPDAATAPPLAVGGVVFYGKSGLAASAVQQIQPGLNPESPEAFNVSSQIDTYLSGRVIELCNHAKPTHLFVRTTGARNSLFVFSYLDKGGQGRVQDAWGRWDFNEELGPVVGMTRSPEGLLVYTLRKARDPELIPGLNDGQEHVYLVVDRVPLTPGLSKLPYLDSQRPWVEVTYGGKSLHTETYGPWYTAFDDSSEYRLMGDALSATPALLLEYPLGTGAVSGCSFTSSFVPTNPYMRDRNGKAITSGQLTVTNLLATFAQSCGLSVNLTARGNTVSTEYNSHVLSSPNANAGREPILDFTQGIPIGHETREYGVSLKSRRWLPFTLTSLEWVGQFFNRTQRF